MQGDVFQHRLRALLISHLEKSIELYRQHEKELEALLEETNSTDLDPDMVEEIAYFEIARHEFKVLEFERTKN